ncbi:MAG: hypothetical protein QM295_03160 [Bacillota bacterium]|jgi:hypothetical protein|nr:hypothetical protein [Bacillota bacterium]
MISLCIDVLSDNLELSDLRELVTEMKDNRKLFINFLINRLESEVEKREEGLLDNGYCPECESKLSYSYIAEVSEVWGHMQSCPVVDKQFCKICGWEGE